MPTSPGATDPDPEGQRWRIVNGLQIRRLVANKVLPTNAVADQTAAVLPGEAEIKVGAFTSKNGLITL